MKTEYIIQALATAAAEFHLPAFADLLLRLSPEAQVQVIHLGLNIRLPFETSLLATAQQWATSTSGISVREWFLRKFTKAECVDAGVCGLLFSNCYLVPEPTRFASCAACSGNIEVPTGRQPIRIDFQHGIGEHDGTLFLSKANAEVIRSSNLRGYTIQPWPNNPRYWQLIPEQVVQEILIEGQNAIGLTGQSCALCGRPTLRYHIGPSVISKDDYKGGDFIRLSFMGFNDIAFSKAAAQFLTSRFRGVRYWQPVWLS